MTEVELNRWTRKNNDVTGIEQVVKKTENAKI